MTPEEKAEELLYKFGTHLTHEKIRYAKAKSCAIICCDEIINICHVGPSGGDYWQQVKQHIQSL